MERRGLLKACAAAALAAFVRLVPDLAPSPPGLDVAYSACSVYLNGTLVGTVPIRDGMAHFEDLGRVRIEEDGAISLAYSFHK